MKYIMYKGEAFEQKGAFGELCNAKDGEIVKGFLIVNTNGEHFILTPTIDYGDCDYNNMLQFFYSHKVKPKTVKKIKGTKKISDFAFEQYARKRNKMKNFRKSILKKISFLFNK